jgi:hypothetical protein
MTAALAVMTEVNTRTFQQRLLTPVTFACSKLWSVYLSRDIVPDIFCTNSVIIIIIIIIIITIIIVICYVYLSDHSGRAV